MNFDRYPASKKKRKKYLNFSVYNVPILAHKTNLTHIVEKHFINILPFINFISYFLRFIYVRVKGLTLFIFFFFWFYSSIHSGKLIILNYVVYVEFLYTRYFYMSCMPAINKLSKTYLYPSTM